MRIQKKRWIDSGFFSNGRRTSAADDVNVCIESTCDRGSADSQLSASQLKMLVQCASSCHDIVKKSQQTTSKRATASFVADDTMEQRDAEASLDPELDERLQVSYSTTQRGFQPTVLCSFVFGDEACDERFVRLLLRHSKN